ncbi:MAG TPA: hypothetical protein VIL74_15115 [Pyrinomonadaceae bacterium]|jgi:hypothetical protein
MKNVPIVVILLSYFVFFCAGYYAAARISIFYLEKLGTQSANRESNPYFMLAAFKANKVEVIFLKDLEEFKRQNPDYSFLVPQGQSDFYNEILAANEKPAFHFEVEQITTDRQLIRFYSSGSKSDGTDTYEATNKGVFPKTTLEFNLNHAFISFIFGLAGGAAACSAFFLINRKYATK